jgi:HK97 family phage prohead protease
MIPQRETRAFRTIELRTDGKTPTIVGHAAIFNRLSEDLGGFREVVLPGAFKRALRGDDDVRALVDHDPSKVIGRARAGTLKLKKDEDGLHVTIKPPNTTVGQDIVESIGRGDVDSMSFGFRTITDHWETQDEEEIRYLEEVELFDVSPVTYPAYVDTDVAVRSLQQWKSSEWKPDAETRGVIEYLETVRPYMQGAS